MEGEPKPLGSEVLNAVKSPHTCGAGGEEEMGGTPLLRSVRALGGIVLGPNILARRGGCDVRRCIATCCHTGWPAGA